MPIFSFGPPNGGYAQLNLNLGVSPIWNDMSCDVVLLDGNSPFALSKFVPFGADACYQTQTSGIWNYYDYSFSSPNNNSPSMIYGSLSGITPPSHSTGAYVKYGTDIKCFSGSSQIFHSQNYSPSDPDYYVIPESNHTGLGLNEFYFPDLLGSGSPVSPYERVICASGDYVCMISNWFIDTFSFDTHGIALQVDTLRSQMLAKAPFAYVVSALSLNFNQDMSQTVPSLTLPLGVSGFDTQVYTLPPALQNSIPTLRSGFKVLLWISLITYFFFLAKRLTSNV